MKICILHCWKEKIIKGKWPIDLHGGIAKRICNRCDKTQYTNGYTPWKWFETLKEAQNAE